MEASKLIKHLLMEKEDFIDDKTLNTIADVQSRVASLIQEKGLDPQKPEDGDQILVIWKEVISNLNNQKP